MRIAVLGVRVWCLQATAVYHEGVELRNDATVRERALQEGSGARALVRGAVWEAVRLLCLRLSRAVLNFTPCYLPTEERKDDTVLVTLKHYGREYEERMGEYEPMWNLRGRLSVRRTPAPCCICCIFSAICEWRDTCELMGLDCCPVRNGSLCSARRALCVCV